MVKKLLTGVCNSFVSLYFINAIVLKTLDSLDHDLLALSLFSSLASVKIYVLVNAHFNLGKSDIESVYPSKASCNSLSVLYKLGEGDFK